MLEYNPQYQREDAETIYYNGTFNNVPIAIMLRKKDGHIYYEMDKVAQAIGYKDAVDMMSDDANLDLYNEFVDRDWWNGITPMLNQIQPEQLRNQITNYLKGDTHANHN